MVTYFGSGLSRVLKASLDDLRLERGRNGSIAWLFNIHVMYVLNTVCMRSKRTKVCRKKNYIPNAMISLSGKRPNDDGSEVLWLDMRYGAYTRARPEE
jgi:hypothetical protein